MGGVGEVIRVLVGNESGGQLGVLKINEERGSEWK